MSKERFPLFDYLRGLAILNMMIFHFFFALEWYGLVRNDFYNGAFWLNYRVGIVTSFATLMGISSQLAHRGQFHWRAFGVRVGKLFLCVAAISIGSYMVVSSRWIFFGILHFFLMASLLAPLFLRFYYFNLILGLGWMVAGFFYHSTTFDNPYLQWIGFVTAKPMTEDFVPLFPWFGLVLIGMFLGRWVIANADRFAFLRFRSSAKAAQVLGWAGQHGLPLFMIHPPVFAALLYPFAVWLNQ